MKENKLIAEFMGGKEKKQSPLFGQSFIEINTTNMDCYVSLPKYVNPNALKYHTSWDWLMPVVEKIECITIDNDDNSDNFFNVMIEVFECNINGGDICICKSGNTKLEATYNAVVEFINQYNKTK